MPERAGAHGEQELKPKALLARLGRGELANVSFGDAQRLLEALGFTLDRVAGSHHIYRHSEVTAQLNLQPGRNGDAKPYQLRQLLQLIDRHALTLPKETQ